MQFLKITLPGAEICCRNHESKQLQQRTTQTMVHSGKCEIICNEAAAYCASRWVFLVTIIITLSLTLQPLSSREVYKCSFQIYIFWKGKLKTKFNCQSWRLDKNVTFDTFISSPYCSGDRSQLSPFCKTNLSHLSSCKCAYLLCSTDNLF